MALPIVTIDCSAGTYMARCREHPEFSGPPQLDKLAARRDADNHRRREHPEQLREALKKRRRRAHIITAAR